MTKKDMGKGKTPQTWTVGDSIRKSSMSLFLPPPPSPATAAVAGDEQRHHAVTPRCDTTVVCVCVITRTTASPGRVNLTSSLRFSPPTETPQQRKFLTFISTFPCYLIRIHSSPCRLGVWVSFTLPPLQPEWWRKQKKKKKCGGRRSCPERPGTAIFTAIYYIYNCFSPAIVASS